MTDSALAVVPSVAILAASALKGLQMVLAHREKKFEHAPLAQMQAELTALKSQMLATAMKR